MSVLSIAMNEMNDSMNNVHGVINQASSFQRSRRVSKILVRRCTSAAHVGSYRLSVYSQYSIHE